MSDDQDSLSQLRSILTTFDRDAVSKLDPRAILAFLDASLPDVSSELGSTFSAGVRKLSDRSRAVLSAQFVRLQLIASLEREALLRLSQRMHLATSTMIKTAFGLSEMNTVAFHSGSGLELVCRAAIEKKYSNFYLEGYKSLQARPPIIYVSSTLRFSTNFCRALGLPLSSIRALAPVPGGNGITSKVLEAAILRDTQAGRVPLMVVLDTESQLLLPNPEQEISKFAALAEQHSLWIHATGQALASLALPSGTLLLRELVSISDSVALRLGEWLGLPVGVIPQCYVFRNQLRATLLPPASGAILSSASSSAVGGFPSALAAAAVSMDVNDALVSMPLWMVLTEDAGSVAVSSAGANPAPASSPSSSADDAKDKEASKGDAAGPFQRYASRCRLLASRLRDKLKNSSIICELYPDNTHVPAAVYFAFKPTTPWEQISFPPADPSNRLSGIPAADKRRSSSEFERRRKSSEIQRLSSSSSSSGSAFSSTTSLPEATNGDTDPEVLAERIVALSDQVHAQLLTHVTPVNARIGITLTRVDSKCVFLYQPSLTVPNFATQVSEIDSFVDELLRLAVLFDSTLTHRGLFHRLISASEPLELVDLEPIAGLGAVKYCPPLLALANRERSTLGAESSSNNSSNSNGLASAVARVNQEVALRLSRSHAMFAPGQTKTGEPCVLVGVDAIPATIHTVTAIVDAILRCTADVEASEKMNQRLEQTIQESIRQAEQDLRRETETQFYEAGIARHIPLVGSVLEWFSPLEKPAEVKGRHFSLASGVVESSDAVVKSKHQAEGQSESPTE